jgi:hypothetical protein
VNRDSDPQSGLHESSRLNCDALRNIHGCECVYISITIAIRIDARL